MRARPRHAPRRRAKRADRMLQPNDLPLLCLPIELSDEAAAKFVEFLHELTAAMERHYCAQLLRYYHRNDIAQRDLDSSQASTNPPF